MHQWNNKYRNIISMIMDLESFFIAKEKRHRVNQILQNFWTLHAINQKPEISRKNCTIVNRVILFGKNLKAFSDQLSKYLSVVKCSWVFNREEMSLDWNEAYKGTPSWDIGHPQPVFEALIGDGEIEPRRALDIWMRPGW